MSLAYNTTLVLASSPKRALSVLDVSNAFGAHGALSQNPTGSKAEDLWSKAVRTISSVDLAGVDLSTSQRTDVLWSVLTLVNKKQEESRRKRWSFKRKDGTEVFVRDYLEKFAAFANRFKDVVDQAVQYDPTHAALPWACIRLCIEVAVGDLDINAKMLEGVETAASIITRCVVLEVIYLHSPTTLSSQLESSLVKLYAAILVYLTKAGRYYSRSTPGRHLISAFQTAESAVDGPLGNVLSTEEDLWKTVQLVDSQYQRTMDDFVRARLDDSNRKLDIVIGQQELLLQGWNHAKGRPNPIIMREKTTNWLAAVSTEQELDSAESLHLLGTCQWIFEVPEFQDWAMPSDSLHHATFLWINGSAGTGKTVMSANIVRYFQNKNQDPVSYFFCTGEVDAKQRPDSIVRSWVAQLAGQNFTALEMVHKQYERKVGQPITISELWHLFHEICSQVGLCTFIIDGFDECSKVEKISRVRGHDAWGIFLNDLASYSVGTSNRVLLVSRDEPELRAILQPGTSNYLNTVMEYKITLNDTEPDLVLFSQKIMDQNLGNKTVELRTELAVSSAAKSEGMFLWVKLMKRSMVRGMNAKQLRKVIEESPIDLSETYERDVARILDQNSYERERAISILHWICFALRPLTIRELGEALLLDVEGQSDIFPTEDLPDSWDADYAESRIRSLCGSLLEFRKCASDESVAKQTVHFIHFSVKEYLVRKIMPEEELNPALNFSDSNEAHELLARACLHYILCTNITADYAPGDDALSAIVEKHGFLLYAAQYWYKHRQLLPEISERCDYLTSRLFQATTQQWRLWVDLIENEVERITTKATNETPGQFGFVGRAAPLYFAAIIGLPHTVNDLLKKGADPNVRGGRFETAAQAAAAKGHKNVLESLLEQGASVHIPDSLFSSVLIAAAVECPDEVCGEIMKVLIEAGCDVSAKLSSGETAMHGLAIRGIDTAVDVLYSYGAIPEAVNSRGSTPLMAAIRNGHATVAKRLIQEGADIHAADEHGTTPLFFAACNSRQTIMEDLVQHGANIHAKRVDGSTPLLFGAYSSHRKVVEYLAQQGADIDAAMDDGVTPLYVACQNGHQSVVEYLIQKGADIHAATIKDGSTPISTACHHGHQNVVEYLIQQGADIDAAADDRATPLYIACQNGHQSVVEYLIQQGSDIHAANTNGYTPLCVASQNGHRNVVEYLAQQGADIRAATTDGLTPLYVASQNGHRNVVECLAQRGADIHVEMKDGWTPLHVAAMNGHQSIVEFLIVHGAKTEAVTRRGQTALFIAAEQGYQTLVVYLVDVGADTSVLDSQGRGVFQAALRGALVDWIKGYVTATQKQCLRVDVQGLSVLHHAALSNSQEMIQWALEHEPNLNIQDNQQWTPLHWAAHCGKARSVEVLRKAGADYDVKDIRGWTPYRVAHFSGHKAITDQLPQEIDEKLVYEVGEELDADCDACSQTLRGSQYHCATCADVHSYDLCFRCYWDVDTLHPNHSFETDFRY